MKKSSRVRKFLKAVDSGRFNARTDDWVDELKRMQSQRLSLQHKLDKSRILKDGKHSQTLIEILEYDAKTRSRSTSIRMDCYEISASLEEYLGRIKKYVKARFGSTLLSFGGVKERDGAVEALFEEASRRMKEFEFVDNYASTLIEDIDQVHWKYGKVIDVLEATKNRNIKEV